MNKGTILSIGSDPSSGYVSGWVIEGADIGLHILEDGTQILGGYTMDELQTIYDSKETTL